MAPLRQALHTSELALRNALPHPARRRLRSMEGWLYRSRLSLASRRPGRRRASRAGAVALEGVAILGMHRSGTSLVTRLVSLLGLALCRDEDLLVGRKANPRGHWESKSLLEFNDRLLEQLDARWFCPPSLEANELSRMLERYGPEALARLHDAHPRRPWVWKDPRTCALLPFWSAVLGPRAAYVLVVRHPLEVSESLARRDGYGPSLGLALWERYTRQAMVAAGGRPMMVCTYDEVLADPLGWCERMLAFLELLGVATPAPDRSVLGAFATSGLRHSEHSWSALRPGSRISAQQVALAQIASQFTAQSPYVTPALPEETPQTQAVFAEIREHLAGRAGASQSAGELPSHLRSSHSARDADAARPTVSLVLTGDVGPARASIASLAAMLPAGSELILMGERPTETGESPWPEGVSVRSVERDRAAGQAQAMALGAHAAEGRIVVFAGAGLLRCDPWYEPFARALAERRVVAVGPVLRFESQPRRRYYGRGFADEDLSTRLIARARARSPVPAALLCAVHAAYNRRVLVAAGGIDEGFDSAHAAVAELSVRLWRMGFSCCIVPQVEAWSENAPQDDREGLDEHQLYDRMRIAALHLDGERLRAFTDRAGRLAAYAGAADRLAASDVEQRRATIAAVCPFPIDRYFARFAPALARRSSPATGRSAPAR